VIDTRRCAGAGAAVLLLVLVIVLGSASGGVFVQRTTKVTADAAMTARFSLLLLGAALALVAPCAVSACVRVQDVGVVAGMPFEFSFLLSRTVISTGTVVFEVRNAGRLPHMFKVCADSGSLGPNYCRGSETRWIEPGSSGRLRVLFAKEGTYEYLCGVRGHAAAGMKGLLTVR
jgi:uncharacterized cupredoxin-like copper-binding protein